MRRRPDRPLTGSGSARLTQDDVVRKIRADLVRQATRGGEGVHLAIVDTGIASGVRGIAGARRCRELSLDLTGEGEPFADPSGHGSMVAAIAAASVAQGAEHWGVAPGASVISCRLGAGPTEADLGRAFRHLLGLVELGRVERLAVNVSLVPAGPRFRSSELLGLVEALAARAVVVFPAGHGHSRLPAHACGPSTIRGASSLASVITVGMVDEADSLHRPRFPPSAVVAACDSGRGPGEFADAKPDCVAPAYGRTSWGAGYVDRPCWGTCGAAAVVTGVAALVLTVERDARAARDAIRAGCEPLADCRYCVGHGRVDAARAVLGEDA